MTGVCAAAIAAATTLGGCAPSQAERAPEPVGRAPSDAARPPDFELDAIDGQSVRLSDHLGKEVILVDFWATFCDPCLAAMPHLDEVYRRNKVRGFVVLGVNVDGPDSAAQVRAEVSKLGVSFPILLDRETRVVALYNPKASVPFSVLIGRDGRVIKKQEGYSTGDTVALDVDIEAALDR